MKETQEGGGSTEKGKIEAVNNHDAGGSRSKHSAQTDHVDLEEERQDGEGSREKGVIDAVDKEEEKKEYMKNEVLNNIEIIILNNI